MNRVRDVDVTSGPIEKELISCLRTVTIIRDNPEVKRNWSAEWCEKPGNRHVHRCKTSRHGCQTVEYSQVTHRLQVIFINHDDGPATPFIRTSRFNELIGNGEARIISGGLYNGGNIGKSVIRTIPGRVVLAVCGQRGNRLIRSVIHFQFHAKAVRVVWLSGIRHSRPVQAGPGNLTAVGQVQAVTTRLKCCGIAVYVNVGGSVVVVLSRSGGRCLCRARTSAVAGNR